MTETIRRADSEVRGARAWLAIAAEPGGSHLLPAFVGEHGPVKAVELIREGYAPVAVSTLMRSEAEQFALIDRLTEKALARAEATGARLVVPEDEEWPTGLEGLSWGGPDGVTAHGPLALWVRGTGNLGSLTKRTVAIIGSRASTAYGEHVAGGLGYQLADRGHVVVSGGAYGIDAAAHRGAIAADEGQTIAVLACGVDRPYPAAHGSLFDRIADDRGLLVSEYAPGMAPLRHRFLARNRLIGALAQGLVVVEAAARSGAQQAARRANELGRPVMACPGPVTSAMSVGCHLMIRDGATLVTSADEVLAAIREGV